MRRSEAMLIDTFEAMPCGLLLRHRCIYELVVRRERSLPPRLRRPPPLDGRRCRRHLDGTRRAWCARNAARGASARSLTRLVASLDAMRAQSQGCLGCQVRRRRSACTGAQPARRSSEANAEQGCEKERRRRAAASHRRIACAVLGVQGRLLTWLPFEFIDTTTSQWLSASRSSCPYEAGAREAATPILGRWRLAVILRHAARRWTS